MASLRTWTLRVGARAEEGVVLHAFKAKVAHLRHNTRILSREPISHIAFMLLLSLLVLPGVTTMFLSMRTLGSLLKIRIKSSARLLPFLARFIALFRFVRYHASIDSFHLWYDAHWLFSLAGFPFLENSDEQINDRAAP